MVVDTMMEDTVVEDTVVEDTMMEDTVVVMMVEEAGEGEIVVEGVAEVILEVVAAGVILEEVEAAVGIK